MHSGYGHFIDNSILLLFIGVPLEMSQGWARVSCSWLAGTLAGSLGAAVLDSKFQSLSGASAVVAAFAGANIATEMMNWEENKFARNIFPIWKRRHQKKISLNQFRLVRVAMSVFYVLANVFLSLEKLRSGGAGANSNTSFTGHFAGAIAGFLTQWVVEEPRGPRPLKTWKVVAKWLCAVALLVLLVWACYHVTVNTVVPRTAGQCEHSYDGLFMKMFKSGKWCG